MKNKLLLGNIIAFLGYLVWGVMPLYWGLLGGVPSYEIIVHRITLSFLLLGAMFLIQRRKDVFGVLKDMRVRNHIIIAGFILLINWTTFIVAVQANRVMECSLAYYINPLIVIAIGMLFFKEPAGWLKLTAVGLALAGVLVLIFGYHQVPYFALIMALSFSIYGVLKKQIKVDPFIGLFFEMMAILPVALGMEIYLVSTGGSVYNAGIGSFWFLILLLLSGLLTVLPLILYNTGLNMISLGNIGFLQFITPTLMFLISVFVNGELFTRTHLISFAFIWLAVIIYCLNLALGAKARRELKSN